MKRGIKSSINLLKDSFGASDRSLAHWASFSFSGNALGATLTKGGMSARFNHKSLFPWTEADRAIRTIWSWRFSLCSLVDSLFDTFDSLGDIMVGTLFFLGLGLLGFLA